MCIVNTTDNNIVTTGSDKSDISFSKLIIIVHTNF